MYGTDYSKWDAIKDSDDDATAPAPAPQKPQSDEPLDPTRVAAMRELLHEIDDGRRPALLKAIEWVEAARATMDKGQEVDDTQCPFDRGSEPWFWFLLLANKPHITLHGPHAPLLARHRSPREQCQVEGLMCANCFAAGGLWQRTPLSRCAACCLAWYCGRECQKKDRGRHKSECHKGRMELKKAVKAAEARRLDGLLPANGKRPALRARHRLDGYGKSALVLYEDEKVDDVHGVVTRPCHDVTVRDRLKPGEALFNVGDYAAIVRDLVSTGLVTPLDFDGPLEEGRAFGRIEVILPEPVAEEPDVIGEPALEEDVANIYTRSRQRMGEATE